MGHVQIVYNDFFPRYVIPAKGCFITTETEKKMNLLLRSTRSCSSESL